MIQPSQITKQSGFSLLETLMVVAVFSGLVYTAVSVIQSSKVNFRIVELRSSISEDHQELDVLFINQDACINTFQPLGNVAGVTPAAPLNVTVLRDGAAAPGNPLLTTTDNNRNYFPRIPTQDAVLGQANAKYRLSQVQVVRGNNTGADVNVGTVVRPLIVPSPGFLASFRYTLTENVGRTVGSATGDRNFFRFIVFRARFAGGGAIASCYSILGDQLDAIYVNMKKDDTKRSPLQIFGRVSVLPHPLFPAPSVTGYAHAQNFYVASDRRIKTNIQSIENPSERLSHLRGVDFSWKQSRQASSGVIAQEVEKYEPNLVIENDRGFKTVNYNSLAALLSGSLKEIKQKNEKLKSVVEKLESDLEASP